MAEVSCFDRAVKLLTLRTHFELELRAKLEKRGYVRSDVDEAIARCLDYGYLDDGSAAKEFVATKRLRSGWGLKKLEAELGRRGVRGNDLSEALADTSEDDELEQATRAAEKAARRRDDRDAIARALSRKGFSPRVILTVLDRRGWDDHDQ